MQPQVKQESARARASSTAIGPVQGPGEIYFAMNLTKFRAEKLVGKAPRGAIAQPWPGGAVIERRQLGSNEYRRNTSNAVESTGKQGERV